MSSSVTAACPFCDSTATVAFVKDGCDICDCSSCGHRFAALELSPQHVDNVYGDDYFTAGGAGYDDYLAEGDLLEAHGKRYADLLTTYTPPGMMLDVGAAAGFIMRGFADGGWTVSGVEPNATMAHHAHQRFDFDVAVGSLEQYQTDTQFDLVSMIQVVGHFYNIRAAYDKASNLLRPGGLLLIESWNQGSWPARLLGEGWHEYSPPSVVHWFTPERLGRHLAAFGFQEVARGKPKKRLNGAHAKSLVGHKIADMPLSSVMRAGLKLVPDNLIIPYPAFDLFWGLYQRQ